MVRTESMLMKNPRPKYYRAKDPKKKGKRRAKKHNYHRPWIYFITINKEETTPLLSHIWRDSRGEVHLELTDFGRLVEFMIENIKEIHPSWEIWKFVIMPDHVHFLLRVRDWLEKRSGITFHISRRTFRRHGGGCVRQPMKYHFLKRDLMTG